MVCFYERKRPNQLVFQWKGHLDTAFLEFGFGSKMIAVVKMTQRNLASNNKRSQLDGKYVISIKIFLENGQKFAIFCQNGRQDHVFV